MDVDVCRLAAEYGLHPVYKREFHDVFDEFREHAEFEPLLQRMKVVDQNGETDMDEDQWEAASAYSLSLPSSSSLAWRTDEEWLQIST